MIGIDWLSTAVLVAITVAIVNAIKAATGDKLKYWYMLISVGVGAAIYAIGTYAPDVVKNMLVIGLAASGLYDIYKKT
jgi:hypothetical protein